MEKLLRAHSLLEHFGMKFLPIPEAGARLQEEFARHTTKPAKEPKSAKFPDSFDVAISFAGPERPFAENLPSIWSRQDFRSSTTVSIPKTYGAKT